MHFIIHTPLLNLVPVEKADLLDVHKLHLLPETNAFNTLGIPKNLAQTKAILANWISRPGNQEAPGYVYTVRQCDTNNFVGLMAINILDQNKNRAEVWYKILPEYWNQGYATNSLEALVRFGFNSLNLENITAGCAIENLASIRVLEKVGMTRVGLMRKSMLLNSGWSDRLEYNISIEDL